MSSGSNAAAATARQAAHVAPSIRSFAKAAAHLQFDNRDIYVDGDAITVRGGCELFLTNGNVVDRTGIVVQDAMVHISNSHVQGGERLVRGGRPREDVRARLNVPGRAAPRRARAVQDQGGNKWR